MDAAAVLTEEEEGEEVENSADANDSSDAAHTVSNPPVLFLCFLLHLTDDDNTWVWYLTLLVGFLFPYLPSSIILFPLYLYLIHN